MREINKQNLSKRNNGGDLNEYAVPKGKKGNHMTKTNKGYTVNHEAQAIILTKAFAKQSSIPGTKEFRELAALHKDFVSFWGKEVQDKQNPGKTVIRAPYGKVKSWYLKKVKEGKIDETLLPTASAEDND